MLGGDLERDPSSSNSRREASPRIHTRDGTFLSGIVAAALALSLGATVTYDALGLTLSHYDAKAHLVVARRIFDSLTPGWRQIGAVWLPLPHVLNAIPIQVDAWYRSGASGVALSMASFVTIVAATAWLVLAITRSRPAALGAAVVIGTDPNLVYLQSTPMTEPLLLALLVLGVARLHRWADTRGAAPAASPGVPLALACLTRYEAWPVTFIAMLFGWGVLVRDGVGRRVALGATARIAMFPVVAILGFLVLSRATVGEWFVAGGFFVIDNIAHRRPLVAIVQVWWGLRQLVGTVTLIAGVAGAAGLVVMAWRRRAAMLLPIALVGTAALPWYAFVSGHPFRIRYMVVLVAAVAACAGIGVGLLPRRLQRAAAALLIVVALVETPPFSTASPLVTEAQWDRPNSIARQRVTACLAEGFSRPDHKVLVSMGSLAHYMQELSRAGFTLDDFIHEGVGQLWPAALASPRRHVEWILFEEQAEGGDILTAERRRSPDFVAGFSRVCSGGGVALYRRHW
jgi:hypothetical protein